MNDYEDCVQITGKNDIEITNIPGMSLPGMPREVNIFEMKNLKLIQLSDQSSCTWLNLRHLPSLEKIVVAGDVKKIVIDSAKCLTSVDLSGCIQLEELIVLKAPKLAALNIDGCRRLGHVSGLDEKSKTQLKIQTQIDVTQARSRSDGSIYQSMTAKDIDEVLKRINTGVRLAKEIGLYTDRDASEDNYFPHQFSIELSYKAFLDSGGTGEMYSHRFMVFQESNDPAVYRSEVHSLGIHGLEEGLTAALNWLVETDCLSIPEGPGSEQERALALMNRLNATANFEKPSALENSQEFTGDVGKLVETALRIGDDPSKRGLSYLQDSDWWNYSSIWQRLGGREYYELVLSELPANLVKKIKEKISSDGDNEAQRYMAAYPAQPEVILQGLPTNLSQNEPTNVVEKAPKSLDYYATMFADKNPSFRISVACDISAPPDILEKLSCDKDFNVRYQLANNPSTPVPVLERLAEDKSADIRRLIASNLLVSENTLEFLSEDKNVEVRLAVVCNEKTPPNVLEKLSDDKSAKVLSSLAESPLVASHVLSKLSIHKSSEVRVAVAKNTSLGLELLEVLSSDKSSDVRKAVSGQHNLPIELIEKLAGDKDEHVRGLIATNRNTPVDMLESLANDVP